MAPSRLSAGTGCAVGDVFDQLAAAIAWEKMETLRLYGWVDISGEVIQTDDGGRAIQIQATPTQPIHSITFSIEIDDSVGIQESSTP
jgi:hypothetical protein